MTGRGYWVQAAQRRAQWVLWLTRLDETIAADEPVRLMAWELSLTPSEPAPRRTRRNS